ncbi:MAG: diguanylate cyclase [Anaerolineae bacterium]|nr:diguanylate cyclase [Anaerolineae bacterium]
MEIKLYLRMLQRGWWIIVLTALIAVNIALIAALLTQPVYRASARFSVSPNPTLVTGADVITSLEALDKRSIVVTYAEFLNSTRIYNETVAALQLTPADVIKYKHSTVVLPEANILALTVEGPDPQLVAILANSVGERAVAHIKDLYKVYDINLLDPAVPPLTPVSPQPLRDGGLALVLGLILGSVLAILREQIRVPLESYRNRMSSDPVSLAFNRRFFDRRLEEEIVQNPNNSLSLGLVKLEGLSGLIDTLPQPLTQQLLRQVTSILRRELRGNDMIARWDDISFAVMLPSTPETAAARTLNRIGQVLSSPVKLDQYGETVRLMPAVSVSTRRDNETATEFITRAEEELERSRQLTSTPVA